MKFYSCLCIDSTWLTWCISVPDICSIFSASLSCHICKNLIYREKNFLDLENFIYDKHQIMINSREIESLIFFSVNDNFSIWPIYIIFSPWLFYEYHWFLLTSYRCRFFLKFNSNSYCMHSFTHGNTKSHML